MPTKAARINYGAKVQAPTPDDDSLLLPPEGIRQVQDIIGMFAWYSRVNAPTMAQTLSSIAGRQSKATQQLREEVAQFLNYCTTHPAAQSRFHASDMVIALHSDASHLSEPGSKSRSAGHFYLTNKGTKHLDNRTILTLSKVIKHVMELAGESDMASLYYNCKNTVPLTTTLEEMGHNQPKARVTTDNASAVGLIDKSMTLKRAKSYDQRFNWLKCREVQKRFDLVRGKCTNNRADYISKRHPTNVYKGKKQLCCCSSLIRIIYLQGCAC